MRYIFLALGAVVIAAFIASCSCSSDRGGDDEAEAWESLTDAQKVRALLDADSVAAWIPASLEMPDSCAKIRTNRIGAYKVVFNDSNHVHWAAAAPVGIEPIHDTRSHWQTRQPLEKIETCKDFYVDRLTHSSPYLVPKAARMVHEIGRRFQDTIQARGGGHYRIKVTSALRTPHSVNKLRRVNRNSTDSSTHMLGTTVDISYARFICDDTIKPHTAEDLKAILAEVLYQMRDEGWCYVKYEAKQPCFHISVRDY